MQIVIKKLAGAAATAVLAIALFLPLSAKAAELPESDDPIRLGFIGASSTDATVHVAGEILKRMGYNVELVSVGYTTQIEALQDGSLTAAFEIWEFTGADLLARALASGNVDMLGEIGIDPIEGLMYPAYVEELCPGLPDWKALQDCAQVFAAPETMPKGRIVDYPADWGNDFNLWRIEGFGLIDNYVVVQAGSEGTLIAEVKSAVARKAPILIVFWTPHWLHGEGLDLKFVKFGPAYEDACGEDPSWGPFPDRIWDCDWYSGWVRKLAWKGAQDKWPVAYNFIREFHISNDFYATMARKIDQEGGDLEEVSQAWVDENEAMWRPWVDAAMAGS